MAEQLDSRRPGTGWGEPLATRLCERVRVKNYAKNGRSTKSYLSEGLWSNLLAQLKADDVVLIQFGHNDQKVDNERLFASAKGDYMNNLRRFVSESRTRGARPVLLTPIVRRSFNAQGQLQTTLGGYPEATRGVAKELSVPLVDMNARTRDLLQSMGQAASSSLFLHLAPNENRNYTDGIKDDTHLNEQGASKIAAIAALELKNLMPDAFCSEENTTG